MIPDAMKILVKTMKRNAPSRLQDDLLRKPIPAEHQAMSHVNDVNGDGTVGLIAWVHIQSSKASHVDDAEEGEDNVIKFVKNSNVCMHGAPGVGQGTLSPRSASIASARGSGAIKLHIHK